MHTNAFLDKAFAGELAESGIDMVAVSLQGLDAQAYQEICGVRTDFDRFYHNLEHFYQRKKKYGSGS